MIRFRQKRKGKHRERQRMLLQLGHGCSPLNENRKEVKKGENSRLPIH